MKQVKHLSAILMAIFVCLFASSAFAQAADPGLDMRAGLSANIIKPEAEVSVMGFSASASSDANYAGLNFKLEFGFRWEYFGVYLAQDLGGVWYTDAPDGADNPGRFFGSTVALFRGIYPIMDNMQVDLGLGLGVGYADGSKDDEEKAPMIMNEDGDNSAAFALKLAFSFNYYVTPMIGVGFFLDYNFLVKKISNDGADLKLKFHQVNPGVQAVIRF